jgi:hypothetical protein|eukprot:TRINITY_DN11510_c0_g4_i1.p1 TRINITY_DN11510_c0_g4~~TRINITY_DN11510_c0_g4_i1.p1  ORF type:complete len:230 (+),score=30.97 TRINITY_DN11510_c0_g4_i1:143-832(+)
MAHVSRRKPTDNHRGEETGAMNTEARLMNMANSTTSDFAATRRGLDEYGTYVNLTPWVTRLIFVHTYYAYTYVFYMFVLAFYKGYALEYTHARRWIEMVLIMVVPFLQHLRFYFGYWGCELGRPLDLWMFLVLCSVVMVVLMYFLFYQAYIMPFDNTFLLIAIGIVGVEGVCGSVNSLQLLKLRNHSTIQLLGLLIGVLLHLGTVAVYIGLEILQLEAVGSDAYGETDV